MKKSFTLKPLALSLIVAGSSVAAIAPATLQAGVSANVGVVSDYIFRGINQDGETGSPAIQGGFDYEHDTGLFAGIWGSSVEKGYEYDVYFGWGGSFNEVDLGIAYTNYSYTSQDYVGQYDGGSKDGKDVPKSGTFEEINLSAGYGPVSIGYDIGDDEVADDKYTHTSISLDLGMAVEGLGITYGQFKYSDADTKPDYFDIGYGTTVEGLDLSVNYIIQGSEMGDDLEQDEENYLVIGVSKSFDLM